MRILIRPILWIATMLFVLLVTMANAPLNRPMFVIAYTGQCGGLARGTCLKEMNGGHVIYWSEYTRQLDGWSADMQYNVFRSPSDYHLYSYSREGSKLTQLTPEDNIQRFVPALSPDGTQLVYAASGDDDTAIEIRTMDMETQVETTVTTFAFAGMRFANEIEWSPDGKQVMLVVRDAYSSYGSSDAQVAIVDVTTGETREVGTTMSTDVLWSPDGQYIAYADPTTDTYSIVNTTTGEHPEALQGNLQDDGRVGYSYYSTDATFAPDGSRLAYVERDYLENATHVKVRDLTTGEETTIAELPNADTRFEDVVWQDDGIWLMEDRIGSPSADLVMFHHIDPETGKRTETGTIYVEDYSQVAEW